MNLNFDSRKSNSFVMGANKGALFSYGVAYSFTTDNRRTSAGSTNTKLQRVRKSSINHNDFMNWTDLETKNTTGKNSVA